MFLYLGHFVTLGRRLSLPHVHNTLGSESLMSKINLIMNLPSFPSSHLRSVESIYNSTLIESVSLCAITIFWTLMSIVGDVLGSLEPY
jgi:hypothetical protein